jgi:hypothetical protein
MGMSLHRYFRAKHVGLLFFAISLLLLSLSLGAFAKDVCPPGQKPAALIACGGGSCTQGCEPDNDGPILEGASCNPRELLKNFVWFHADAPNSAHTAEVRGILMRIANSDTTIAIQRMREAYKEGQRHKPSVAALIDYCDNETVRRTTYNFAEIGRLQKCGDSSLAISATCPDIRENLRWALDDAETCFIYAHWFMKIAVDDSAMTLRERGEYIRDGFKIAQGHKQEVFDSIDYIGDLLLVEMVRQYDKKSHLLEGKYYAKDNGAETACPGIKKRFRHWTYGAPP